MAKRCDYFLSQLDDIKLIQGAFLVVFCKYFMLEMLVKAFFL